MTATVFPHKFCLYQSYQIHQCSSNLICIQKDSWNLSSQNSNSILLKDHISFPGVVFFSSWNGRGANKPFFLSPALRANLQIQCGVHYVLIPNSTSAHVAFSELAYVHFVLSDQRLGGPQPAAVGSVGCLFLWKSSPHRVQAGCCWKFLPALHHFSSPTPTHSR